MRFTLRHYIMFFLMGSYTISLIMGWIKSPPGIADSVALVVGNGLIYFTFEFLNFLKKKLSGPMDYETAWNLAREGITRMEVEEDEFKKLEAMNLDWVEMARIIENVHGTKRGLMWKIFGTDGIKSYVVKIDPFESGKKAITYLGKNLAILKPKISTSLVDAEKEVKIVPAEKVLKPKKKRKERIEIETLTEPKRIFGK